MLILLGIFFISIWRWAWDFEYAHPFVKYLTALEDSVNAAFCISNHRRWVAILNPFESSISSHVNELMDKFVIAETVCKGRRKHEMKVCWFTCDPCGQSHYSTRLRFFMVHTVVRKTVMWMCLNVKKKNHQMNFKKWKYLLFQTETCMMVDLCLRWKCVGLHVTHGNVHISYKTIFLIQNS